MANRQRNRILWLLAGSLLFASACSDRTGVILEVTRDEASTSDVAIDSLHFYMGVEAAETPNGFTDFVNGSDTELVAMNGRDLAKEPFKMLFTPKQVEDTGFTVAVVGMSGGEPVAFGGIEGQIQFQDGDVLSFPVTLYGTEDLVDVTSTGCLIVHGEDGSKVVIAPQNDLDCDNDPADVDCDETDPTVGPSAGEQCFNDRDDDCDDVVDEQEDRDGDGVLNCDDCDDGDKDRFPGNPEVCDAKDNDCNGVCDDGHLDTDGDKFTECGTRIREDGTCGGPSDELFDCNDEVPTTHPGAEEICDGVDNDCNEVCDDDFDPDGDFYTSCGSKVTECTGTDPGKIDCEPDDEDAFPGNLPEYCDGVDNDCDGNFYPAQVPCYTADSSGGTGDECKLGTRACGDAGGDGWTGDCIVELDSEVVPGELCTAYGACTDEADPFACANAMVTATNYQCTVYFPSAEPSQVCHPNGVALPNEAADGANCRWLMTALGIRPRYSATLAPDLDAGTTPVKAFDACDGVFSIIAPLVVPPRSEGFLVLQMVDANRQELIRLNVTPQAVTECPVNGLECTGLISPVPPAP